MTQVLVISGSPRTNGGTALCVSRLVESLGAAHAGTVDLGAVPLQHFRYGAPPEDDAFMEVVDRMLQARAVVFVTPVYWYAMSGLMKVMFDRLTDLILTPERRPVGRRLAGRDIWALACGTDPELPAGFEIPFSRTADYFGCRWRDIAYVQAVGSGLPAEDQLVTATRLGRRIASGV